PTNFFLTSPPLKRITVGIALMLYLTAMLRLASVSTLPTLTLPANSSATASMVGASIRQGMHHSAQKSTSTGVPALSTSASKLASVNSLTLALAMDTPWVGPGIMIWSPRGGCQTGGCLRAGGRPGRPARLGHGGPHRGRGK